MPIPETARRALIRRLEAHRQQRWLDLVKLDIRYRGSFAYIEGTTSEDDALALCRLRWLGSAQRWGFAVYLPSKDAYEDSVLPSGSFTGTPEESIRLRLRSLPQRRQRLDRSTPDRFTRELLTGTT